MDTYELAHRTLLDKWRLRPAVDVTSLYITENDIDESFLEVEEELFEMILDQDYESLPLGKSIIE